jgi:hypothetical protein
VTEPEFEYEFRQSDLNTYNMCPEQYRLDKAGELPRMETEATAVGTAVHAGIEAVLRREVTLDEGHDRAVEAFAELVPTIQKWNKADEQTCFHHVMNCYSAWADQVYPMLGEPMFIEESFKVLLSETPKRRIWLKGTVDFVDSDGDIWDWKNMGSEIPGWEAERFKIQPTAYTLAAHKAWGIESPKFYYAVMLKRAKPAPVQVLEVRRNERHWEWLRQQAEVLAMTIEANMPRWQLRDQGWHCSPKWCGAWDRCKGAVL